MNYEYQLLDMSVAFFKRKIIRQAESFFKSSQDHPKLQAKQQECNEKIINATKFQNNSSFDEKIFQKLFGGKLEKLKLWKCACMA